MSWNNPRDLVIEWKNMYKTLIAMLGRAKTHCVHNGNAATGAKGGEHNPMSDFDISILYLILMH